MMFALGLCGLVLSLFQLVSLQQKVNRATDAQKAAESYLSTVKDIETAYRGYVIAGTRDYLAPYDDASANLKKKLEELRIALANARLDPQSLQAATASSSSLLAFAGDVIAARGRSVEEARTMVRSGRGKQLMDEARATSQLITSQAVISVLRFQKEGRTFYPILAIASILLIAAASYMLWKSAKHARKDAEAANIQITDVVVNAPVGLALLDNETRISRHNGSFTTLGNAKAKSLIGQKLQDALPDLYTPESEPLLQAVAHTAKTRRASTLDSIELTAEGMPRYLNITIFPVGRSNHAGVILSDMTHQRNWEIQLENAKDAAETANRAKSSFLANMSHELRTPLSAVLGYCELIEDDLRDSGDTHIIPDLTKISMNAKHLLTLINDVLDLSKIEAQKMDVHAIDFEIDHFLKEIEAATGSLVTQKGNTITYKTARPGMTMHSDDLKVKQILVNLISNAGKFTTNGQVTVTVDDTSIGNIPGTRFTVRDTGVGLSPEQLANLFRRFSQADETTTRKYGGTGLGLALTRGLATILGGTIEVESTKTKAAPSRLSCPQCIKAAQWICRRSPKWRANARLQSRCMPMHPS